MSEARVARGDLDGFFRRMEDMKVNTKIILLTFSFPLAVAHNSALRPRLRQLRQRALGTRSASGFYELLSKSFLCWNMDINFQNFLLHINTLENVFDRFVKDSCAHFAAQSKVLNC